MKITRRQLKNFLNEAMRQRGDAERAEAERAEAREATGSSAVRYEVLLILFAYVVKSGSLSPIAMLICFSYMFLPSARVVINTAFNAGKLALDTSIEAIGEFFEYLWESNKRDWTAQLINEGIITSEHAEQMNNEYA